MENKKLIKMAHQALKNSYSPYSNFPVGCAIELENGKIFTGINIENASFGATVCAERVAIFNIISAGEDPQKIQKIAIISKQKNYTAPCSICRQVISEFCMKNTQILMANYDQEYIKTSVEELIPYSFTKKDLDNV